MHSLDGHVAHTFLDLNPMDPKYPPPTEIEWANAEVQVIRFDNSPIIGLRKDLEKNNVPYTQTVWLTIPQLRGLAIEETF